MLHRHDSVVPTASYSHPSGEVKAQLELEASLAVCDNSGRDRHKRQIATPATYLRSSQSLLDEPI